MTNIHFLLILLISLPCYISLEIPPDEDLEPSQVVDLFNKFVKEYGKIYPTPAEQTEALSAFSENWVNIQELNDHVKNQNLKFGFNQYSDLADSDFSEIVVNLETSESGTQKSQKASNRIGSVPSFLDWRTRKDTVGPVRNQGTSRCGWAYAASAVVQSAYSLKTARLVQPSEVDVCNSSSAKNLESGFEWMKTFGVHLESSAEKITLYDVSRFVPIDTDDLQRALMNSGPIAVTFKVGTSFRHYKSGVFNSADCGNTGTFLGIHAAVLVGYGEDYGSPYWIVKNSWGENFGEQGYVKMLRMHDLCGIESDFAYSVQI